MPETAEYPQPMEEELEAHDDDANKVMGKLDEHNTMLGGIVRVGRVVEGNGDDAQDPGDIPRVLVQIGGSEKGSHVRNWLPWVTARAGYDGEWWRPDLDEQVLVLAPSGNITQGIIVGSLYRGCLTFDSGANGAIEHRDPLPASEVDQDIHQRFYKDGTSIHYDRNKHRLTAVLKNAPEGDPLITILADADRAGEESLALSVGDGTTHTTIKNDGTITLSSGATTITVNRDGAVSIDVGSNDITVTGNVKVTGTLDVS